MELQFYGVACDRPPIAVVMEYCPGGSLECHLKKEKENIVIGERIEYCLEVWQQKFFYTTPFYILIPL